MRYYVTQNGIPMSMPWRTVAEARCAVACLTESPEIANDGLWYGGEIQYRGQTVVFGILAR